MRNYSYLVPTVLGAPVRDTENVLGGAARAGSTTTRAVTTAGTGSSVALHDGTSHGERESHECDDSDKKESQIHF
jgi:hypothetical protein